MSAWDYDEQEEEECPGGEECTHPVLCDSDCMALRHPGTIEQALATVEHYQEHRLMSGCAGCGS